MSIASEIQRIKDNIEDAYEECENKGATMPATQNSDNLANTISTISGGGGADLNDYFKTEWNSNPGVDYNFANQMKKIPTLTFGSSVIKLDYLFSNIFIENFVVPTINQTNAASMTNMFTNFGGKTIDLINLFNTQNITSMSYCFYQCAKLTDIYNIDKLDTSNTTTLSNMFYNDTSLTSLDLSSFDTSKVTTMERMFNGNSSLTSLDLSSFDTSKNLTFSYMFYNCGKLTQLLIPNFTLKPDATTTSGNRISLNSMFYGTIKLASLDISGMDFSGTIFSFSYMFNLCGRDCLQSDGAYADGIPYIYVKDATAQNWVLTANNGHPTTWSTNNVVIKSN